jgi:hypothetical protein
MKVNRQIAAGIDQRVRQLAGQNLSDSALVDQMVAYMADLQRLWDSATDEELEALCEEYPGFVRYATLMESVSEALRTGIGVPAHIKELAPLPQALQQAMMKLMSDGAELERGLQQRIEDGSPRRAKAKVPAGQPHNDRNLEDLYQQWSSDFASFVAAAQASTGPTSAQRLVLLGVQGMAMRIEELHTTAGSSEAVAEHHKVSDFRPRMTVNRSLMTDFMSAETPSFALGLVEERQRLSGFMALHPDDPIPAHVTDVGCRFGFGLIGTNDFEVIDFVFEFYGHALYHALVNPNNPLVRRVLATIAEAHDYVLFTVNTRGHGAATCFRAALDVSWFKEHMPRIERSTTTEAQYRWIADNFARAPQPPGRMLHWVCRDNVDYLDLTHNPLEMSPSR